MSTQYTNLNGSSWQGQIHRRLLFTCRLFTSYCKSWDLGPSQPPRPSEARWKVARLCWYELRAIIYQDVNANTAEITSAFMTRTRLIFEDEVWNTAYKPLWGDVRAPSIFGNQLLASLAHVPGLLQDQEELVLTQDDHLRQEIISKIKVQLSLLYTWRWHFEHPDSSCGPDVDWQPEHHVLGLTHSYTSVCPSWRQALEVTCYNMAVLSLLGMLWSLEGRPEGGPLRFYSDNVPLSVPPLPNQISSLEQVATVVCRGFEDSLRSGLMQRA